MPENGILLNCPVVMDVCTESEPEFKDIGGEHWVACFRV
jgi:hypothetical protein